MERKDSNKEHRPPVTTGSIALSVLTLSGIIHTMIAIARAEDHVVGTTFFGRFGSKFKSVGSAAFSILGGSLLMVGAYLLAKRPSGEASSPDMKRELDVEPMAPHLVRTTEDISQLDRPQEKLGHAARLAERSTDGEPVLSL